MMAALAGWFTVGVLFGMTVMIIAAWVTVRSLWALMR